MSADKIVEMCLRFAGFDKDIIGEINVDEFMSQAAEYQQMVDESKEGAISKISINGQTQFKKGEWFAEESVIRMIYITYAGEEIAVESITKSPPLWREASSFLDERRYCNIL